MSSKATAPIKPKPIEPTKKSPKPQPSNDDKMEYDIEDPDVDDSDVDDGNVGDGKDVDDNGEDDQYSIEEAYAELSKTESEHSIRPKYKSLPNQTSSTKKSPPAPNQPGSTILNFFKPVSKPASTSTPESQEKRPRSTLVASLENDFHRKCPKIEREPDSVAMENQEVSPTAQRTPQQEEQDLENEQMEASKKKKRSKSNPGANPFALPDYESTPMDQDGIEVNSENLDTDPDCKDLNATRWEDCGDMFDDSFEDPKTPEPEKDDSPITKNSPTPSKVNDRPRGQSKFLERRSTEQSSPSGSTVHSEPSSEDILTKQTAAEPISNNDQVNSDLNTEADQLKALNVTSDQ